MRIRKAFVFLAGTALCLLPLRGEHVWIEAEAPTASNFPPASENPFAPRAFWEEDLLSGGEWVGMYWKIGEGEQPFLEYQFETKSPGDFALYSRKFYTYGNFRWRVDDGPWQEIPTALHEELDSVALRDMPAEKISVTWHYMGSVALQPGIHRLRIEPKAGAMPQRREGLPSLPGYPLAYDAFLLTTEPFMPAGKLKPGERFAVRGGPSFAFQAGQDPFLESPIDWRRLNESFAGERGGITVKNGRLVHRKDGSEVRLLGVNTRPGLLAAPETALYLTRLLAKKGVNLVRFDVAHLFSAERSEPGEIPTLHLDPQLLESFLQMVADLKTQGIYTALAWNFSNVRKAAELVGGAPGMTYPSLESSYHVLFDPRIQKSIQEGWVQVLSGRVPGSNQPLAKDPALALITLGQQLSAYAIPGGFEPPIPESILAAREEGFRKWVEKKYRSLQNAWKAWEKSGEAASASEGPLLPPMEDIAQARGGRARDAAEFLSRTQRAWLDALASEIRKQTGYPGLVSYSNRPVAYPETLGLPAAWASFGGDVTERVGLFIAPYEAPENPWVIAAGGKFHDRSALRFDSFAGQGSYRFDLPLKAIHYFGKPSVLTEVGWSAPNRFRAEAPLVSALLASVQDVRLLAFQGMLGFDWHQSLPTGRVPFLTPATLGQFPAISYAFRKGLLSGPFQAASWQIPEERIFSLQPASLAETREMRVESRELPALESGDAAELPTAALYLAGKISIESAAGEERLVVEQSAAAGLSEEMLNVGNGAIRWDVSRGLLLAAAPQFEAVAGFLRQAGPRSAGTLEVRSDMDFGVVCLVALDNKPLDFSSKMLLQVFSEEHNAGEFIEDGSPRVLRSIGRPPILVRELQGIVALNRPDAREILATALDVNGYPVLPAGHAHNLQLLPATLYYLLEK